MRNWASPIKAWRGGAKTSPRAAVVEWAGWMILIGVLWLQTGFFSEPIREYRFGADGWPRAILICLMAGVTLQMIAALRATPASAPPKATPDFAPTEERPAGHRAGRWQRAGIFCLPLVYLWAMQRIGFFVATPIFVAGYLYVLEVRRWRMLAAVTAGICLVMMIIFVRLFYVALPVGIWPLFYDLNHAALGVIRSGL